MMQQTTMARELQWVPAGTTEPRTIRVNVGLPELDPALGGYQCTLTVEGFGESHARTFHDAEPMLALTYTLNILPHVIEHLVRRAGGGSITSRLRILDDQDPPEMERELEYLAPGASTAVSIKVVVSLPVQEHDERWSCTLTITGFGEDHAMTVQHGDTLGAIMAALDLAPTALRQHVEPGGRLTYLGKDELGFPVARHATEAARARTTG